MRGFGELINKLVQHGLTIDGLVKANAGLLATNAEQQRAIDALIQTNDAQQEAIDLALRAAENLSQRLRILEDERQDRLKASMPSGPTK
jgi:hypothetical protein